MKKVIVVESNSKRLEEDNNQQWGQIENMRKLFHYHNQEGFKLEILLNLNYIQGAIEFRFGNLPFLSKTKG